MVFCIYSRTSVHFIQRYGTCTGMLSVRIMRCLITSQYPRSHSSWLNNPSCFFNNSRKWRCFVIGNSMAASLHRCIAASIIAASLHRCTAPSLSPLLHRITAPPPGAIYLPNSIHNNDIPSRTSYMPIKTVLLWATAG